MNEWTKFFRQSRKRKLNIYVQFSSKQKCFPLMRSILIYIHINSFQGSSTWHKIWCLPSMSQAPPNQVSLMKYTYPSLYKVQPPNTKYDVFPSCLNPPNQVLSMKELQTTIIIMQEPTLTFFLNMFGGRGITNQLAGKWKPYYEDYPKIDNLNPDGSIQALS